MALPNPMYIDAEAIHPASAVRLLAFAATEGKEGVVENTDLRIMSTPAPSGAIRCMPGAYVVRAKHTGGEKEAYAGKVVEAEDISVNPTAADAGRTDLVILRIENPYVAGSGSWAQPTDPQEGPYAHIRVIEGVPANTQAVQFWNSTWTAITLARITRAPNRTTVEQSEITDLRSLAKIANDPIVEEDPPDDNPPAIAYPFWMDIVNETSSGDDDTISDDAGAGFLTWPADATWSVPIPSWATHAEVFLQLLGIRQEGAGTYGSLRVQIDGGTAATPAVTYDFTTDGTVEGWRRDPMFAAGTVSIPTSIRGKSKTFRAQATIEDDPGQDGTLRWTRGSAAILQVVFKQAPSYD
jgi:hypothetical protein